MFLIFIINTGLLIGTAYLMKRATTNTSSKWLWLTLFGGIATLIFTPVAGTIIATTMSIPLSTVENSIGAVWQLAWEVCGIYFIGWSIVKFFKRRKNKTRA